MKGVVEMLCLMKIADVLICSVVLMLLSTQTVFGFEIDFSDSAVMGVARGIALVIFVKVLISITGSGIRRFRDYASGGGSYSDRETRRALREQRKAKRANRSSKVYDRYGSNGVDSSISDQAFEAMVNMGDSIRRAGSWVGRQITKPVRLLKNRLNVAKDVVKASKAPTVKNIANAGSSLAGGIANEKKILLGLDKKAQEPKK